MSAGSDNDNWQDLLDIEGPPHVRELYNLIGIAVDLEFARDCFERLAQNLEADPEDYVGRQAYFSAAVIAYSRCWGTGVRGRLSVDILDRVPQESPSAAQDVHQYIRDMRDKHVAHSINPFETIMVAGRADWSDRQNPEVAAGFLRVHGLIVGIELARTCKDLANCLVNLLKSDIELINEKVLEAIKAEGADKTRARPTKGLTIPSPSDAGTPRQFGRGK